MMPLRTGEMRFRATLQVSNITVDAEGVPSKQPTTLATVWAAKRGLNGHDYWAAAAIEANDDEQYIIRYRTDVDTTCLLVLSGNSYRIMSASDVDGDKRFLTLMCRRVTSGGI